METLPQEVVDQIASNLYRPDLKSLLLLSPTLRMAAEKYSEGFTRCKLHYKSLDKFVEKFRGTRFCWLRELEFDLRLPEILDHDGISPANGLAEAKAYDEDDLSTQICALFNALKSLEDFDGPQGTIQLKITNPERLDFNSTNTNHTASWHDHLHRLEQLPVLQSIGSLYVGPPANRQASNSFDKLGLRTPLDLSAKLPNLGMLRIDLIDEHHCDSESERNRVEAREDFARVAQTISLQVKRAEIILQSRKAHEILDHDSAMPNLVRAGLEDPFSSSLRVLCRHLTQLQLSVIIDKSFFWPDDGQGDIWPNMESLEVKFHPVTPTGSWYFVGPRGEGSNVQGYPVDGIEYSGGGQVIEGDTIIMGHAPCRPSGWRLKPNPETLHPFLTAFAKAAAKMPRLKEAMIWSPIWWSPGSHARARFSYHSSFDMMNNQRPLGWGIGYNAPGTDRESDGLDSAASEESDNENVRLFEWRTGSWEPSEELKDLFHEIGRKEFGDEFDDDWDPDANQEDLFFEGFCFGKELN
ncbi:hypothetical protein ColTof4_13158 [Colletotrichum tofieldiae]|uniref:F-box domain-containing protein n=1 Tax=Colletotrichum tofieldiae TaxID=708197 RepID=A0A166T317_9PEZI|nr:hypothetical protein CT0861_05002 [Colletotrichum tofieldiae]GKT52869.1 hypothetical protein ColTof3_00208 [Colletotrichum tofieldiae]GKT80735.1 hypothetical protein ColTof4_13158 [Colletotrichum tofieldiae]